MIVREYIINETTQDQLLDILSDFFGEKYNYTTSNGWTYIYKVDFAGYCFELPSSESGATGLWGGYRDSDESSWNEISQLRVSFIKIRFYKEEGKYIYATGISSDNKEYYAGGWIETSSCFVWVDSIFYDYGVGNNLRVNPILADNYISLAPFFNPYEKLSNPDYTDYYIPAIRPSLDGTYTVFNINGEQYATMCKNLFVKI